VCSLSILSACLLSTLSALSEIRSTTIVSGEIKEEANIRVSYHTMHHVTMCCHVAECAVCVCIKVAWKNRNFHVAQHIVKIESENRKVN